MAASVRASVPGPFYTPCCNLSLQKGNNATNLQRCKATSLSNPGLSAARLVCADVSTTMKLLHRVVRQLNAAVNPTKLTFTRALSTPANPVRLVIKAHGGSDVKTVKLDVNSTDTVESVKSKIQDAAGTLLQD